MGVEQGGSFSGFLQNFIFLLRLQTFVTKFCKMKRQLEKDKKATIFEGEISRVTRSCTTRWDARDRRAIDTQTSFTCDEPRGTATQHFMGLLLSQISHCIFILFSPRTSDV